MRERYITIQGFMISELGLSGNDLLIYALVYGFSQDGESEFYGSLSHLSEMLRLDRRTVIRVLDRLVEQRLVRKRSGEINGVHRCFYSACAADDVHTSEHAPIVGSGKMPPVAKCHQDSGKMPPPNINNKIILKEKTTLKGSPKEKAAEAAPSPLNLSRFRKPTVEAVAEYCRSRGNNVDAERFWNFYESQGWRVGKNPMKDWQAAVRTWEKRDSKEQEQKQYRNDRETATSREQRLAEARRVIVASIEQNERAYAAPTDTGEVLPEELFGGL